MTLQRQTPQVRDSGVMGKRRSLVASVLSGRSTAPRAESGALEGEVCVYMCGLLIVLNLAHDITRHCVCGVYLCVSVSLQSDTECTGAAAGAPQCLVDASFVT